MGKELDPFQGLYFCWQDIWYHYGEQTQGFSFLFFFLLIFFLKYAFSCQNHIEEVGSDEGNLWLRSLREQQNHFIITSFACTDVWVWEHSRGLLFHPPTPWQNQLILVMDTPHPPQVLPRYSHPDFFILPVRKFLGFVARYLQDGLSCQQRMQGQIIPSLCCHV